MIRPNIMSTNSVSVINGVKILVYGKAGRGKTTLCATCPNPIILSAESGLLSLGQYNLPYIEIRNMNDLRSAHTWAKSSPEARQFQTLCLDSLSEIGEIVLGDAKARSAVGSKSGKGDNRQAYGDMIEDMSKLIREFRDLQGYHVYMSAKQEYVKNEVTGVTMNGPSMPGSKLAQSLPYWFDEVFQLEIEGTGANSYRYLRTQPDFMNDAKDRSGRLDPIEEPHLGKVIHKITLASQRVPGAT